MTPDDPDLADFANRTWARVSALERLVCEFIGDKWSPERVMLWSELLTQQNDSVATPSEPGRADLQAAMDRLATRLLQASRRAHGQ